MVYFVDILTGYAILTLANKTALQDDADEEEEENIKEEIDMHEDAIGNTADLVSRLLRHHGQRYLPFFQPIIPFVQDFIKPTSRIAER